MPIFARDFTTQPRDLTTHPYGKIMLVGSVEVYYEPLYPLTVDLPRLTSVESRWSFIIQRLHQHVPGKWATLLLKGQWNQFEIDISAAMVDIDKRLANATASAQWPSEHFPTELDTACYRLVINDSTSTKSHLTTRISPPGPVVEMRTYHSGPIPDSVARERFRQRRKEKREARERMQSDQ